MQRSVNFVSLAQTEYHNLITKSFQRLLETKHLYQSIKIDINSLLERFKIKCGLDRRGGELALYNFQQYISFPWNTKIGTRLTLSGDQPQSEKNIVPVNLPTIKVYCELCKRIEPFNPFSVHLLETQKYVVYPGQGSRQACQVFFLEYQCQSCKGIPEIFLVRKEGYRISLHGRSPMEVYPCPPVIPKKFRNYFSDSVVAFNSGQVLAALFLARTFIEQFTRFDTKANNTKLVDDVLSEYMVNLPSDFKERFPSLKKIYSDLSSAIHKAEPNDALFTKVKNEIVEHFEAKHLFKLN